MLFSNFSSLRDAKRDRSNSSSKEMLRYSIRLVIHYLKYGTDALRALCAGKLQAIA
ncbi:hypothetical protein COO91_08673 [Nostoc flagelliforme CCNUN1]|uniref:Transposase n=1 Tax=Nostoc flagelliforme CCNUN1 TaxID=2038116 RepID=A0A2K8T4L8_9NOSO|nr:hypothetical protein COO91_08673 [Nostoc flagelliforme CCNUN1]